MDNVLPFPTKLDKLAEKIRHDIDVRGASREAWVAATLDLCLDLAEARAEFAANSDFSRWLEANGIEMNNHDRGAAIAMGQDPKRAADVLATTERRSLQLIHKHEFHCDDRRLASASKTPGPETKTKPHSAERLRALAAYDAIKAAGEPLTYETVKNAAGCGWTAVRATFTLREAEQEKTAQPIDWTSADVPLTEAQKLKLGAEKERYRREVWAGFEAAVAEKSRQWCEDIGMTAHRKELDELKSMLTTPRTAVMRKAEYNTILMCLHPDRIKAITEAQLAEAFRIFTHYKLKMVDDEEERIEARRKLRSNMPASLAEMLARKTQKTK